MIFFEFLPHKFYIINNTLILKIVNNYQNFTHHHKKPINFLKSYLI